MMQNLITKSADSAEAIRLLWERCGISRFYTMPEYDCHAESVSMFLIRREKAIRELQPLLPCEIQLKAAACVQLLPGLSQTISLSKLCISSWLPIRLPLIPDGVDWMFPELNKIFYHMPYHLIFLSFDLYPLLYPPSIIDQLIRLPNTAYQFNYKSLQKPEIRKLIKGLIDRNAPVLFGTSVNSVHKARFYEFDEAIKSVSSHFSEIDRDAMFFRKFPHRK